MARLAPLEDKRAWPALGPQPDQGGEDHEDAPEPSAASRPQREPDRWDHRPIDEEAWSGGRKGYGEWSWKGGKGNSKGRGRRRKGEGKWAPKGARDAPEEGWDGGWEEGSDRRGKDSFRRGKGSSGIVASDLLGEWLDGQDNDVVVQSGPERSRPLTARLARRGGREQVLSLRREPESDCWACGNAVLDKAASTTNVLVWAAYDGRRSVWRRKEVSEQAEPNDLLPWLLKAPALLGASKGDEEQQPQAKAANGRVAEGFAPPPRRQRNWSSISMDSDVAGVFVGQADWEDPKDGEEGAPTMSDHETPQDRPPAEEAARLPAVFDTDNASADAARVSAILDARQVLGSASNFQEIFSHLLIDHDLLCQEGEDPMVPSIDSALWQRLPDAPRRNVLHRLAAFQNSSFVPGSYVAEFPAGNWSELFVGRHRFPVLQTDIQALLRRYTLSADNVASRASAMARVFALYRALENPVLTAGQRSSHQLCTWRPSSKEAADVEYELFASPFNARVGNGKYASRFPHAEKIFGSAGSYPDVLDEWPSTAVVSVNPPFSDAYLDDVVGKQLDRIVAGFKKVHLLVPVRDAPWRKQLRRLSNARFVQDFFDATALKDRHLEQPVLHWEGSELAPAEA